MVKISIVMPVYNEAASITNSVREIHNFLSANKLNLGSYELIVVDDGSTDDTVKNVVYLQNKMKELRLVKHEKNMGVGAALRTGLKAARGDIIITTDSDLTYSPEDMTKLVDKMKESGADMVIGTPFANGGNDSQIPFLRKILSVAANKLDSVIFNLKCTTSTCIFRAWKRQVSKKATITFDRFEGVSESAIDASKKGFKITEVGVTYRLKEGRKSSMNILKTIRQHLLLIYTLKWGKRK